MKVNFLSAGMEKGIKYSQDQSSIMLLFEHNLRHNAIILRVTLKSIVLMFSNIYIMYLTLTLIDNLTSLRIQPFLLAPHRELGTFRQEELQAELQGCYKTSSVSMLQQNSTRFVREIIKQRRF